jgi:hypothetical protein
LLRRHQPNAHFYSKEAILLHTSIVNQYVDGRITNTILESLDRLYGCHVQDRGLSTLRVQLLEVGPIGARRSVCRISLSPNINILQWVRRRRQEYLFQSYTCKPESYPGITSCDHGRRHCGRVSEKLPIGMLDRG